MSAAFATSERQAQRAGSGEAAGLVPYKTRVIGDSSKGGRIEGTWINLSAPECAIRRLNRLKKSVWASGHLHGLAEKGFRASQAWFVTLTYRGVRDWQPNHIKDALNAFRRWCKFRGVPCRYTWVAELQSRGAVHYHMLCWLPVNVRMPQWDRPTVRRTTNGLRRVVECFWSHGMTNTQKALSGVGYLMKYLSKLGELTVFPKGLRLYGIGGLDATGRNVRSWFNLPGWVKQGFGVGEVRRSGSALVVLSTGEILDPAYRVQRVPGALIVQPIREFFKRFSASIGYVGAYSSVEFV